MSQIEQRFMLYLNRHPEIRAARGLLNIRALARSFIREENLNENIEAVVATIRRADIRPLASYPRKSVFSDIKISMKDEIVVLDYEKSKELMERLKLILSLIDFDKHETMKIVAGSQSVKVIVDSSNRKKVKEELGRKYLIKEYASVSEISLLFSSKAKDEKGIVAYVSNELLLNGINMLEIISCTPELIIYIDEKESIKTFEVIKRIKNS